ncbi:MAG: acyltransferase [Phormidesmis sp.]
MISTTVRITPSNPKLDRIASVELFRIFAIFAVVLLHTQPFGFAASPGGLHTFATLINLCCRFAVPFFFIAAGFFFGEKIGKGAPVMATFWKSARRLLKLYVGWSLLYILMPLEYGLKHKDEFIHGGWLAVVVNNLKILQTYGLNLPFQGAKEVLWFLPALAIGLGIVAGCEVLGWRRYLPFIAIALYTIGLLGGSYSQLWTDSSSRNLAFNTRNGPFFSTLFVSIGWLISKRQQKRSRIAGQSTKSSLAAIAIMLGGLLLQIIEAKGLSAAAAVPLHSFDYSIGTVFFATGVFLLALARPTWGKRWPILSWSRYTLGVYLIHHVIVFDLLYPFTKRYNNTLWEIALPIAVYLASVGMIALVSRWRLLRPWVM